MPLGRSLVVVVLLLSVAGCSPHATRYTWAGDEANLKQSHAACVQEINKEYVPRAHGAGAPVMLTLYKDCMEKRGYKKTGSDEIPLLWDEKNFQWVPEPPTCGAPNQTCLWFRPV